MLREREQRAHHNCFHFEADRQKGSRIPALASVFARRVLTIGLIAFAEINTFRGCPVSLGAGTLISQSAIR